jgi:hypothetical protein
MSLIYPLTVQLPQQLSKYTEFVWGNREKSWRKFSSFYWVKTWLSYSCWRQTSCYANAFQFERWFMLKQIPYEIHTIQQFWERFCKFFESESTKVQYFRGNPRNYLSTSCKYLIYNLIASYWLCIIILNTSIFEFYVTRVSKIRTISS